MFRVDDTQFQNWARRVELKIKTGLYDALIDAGLYIRDVTTPLVPLDRGYLERSYRQRIYTLTTRMVLEFGYSVLDNPYSRGYDYSWVQHERPFRHPKRGTWKYLDQGVLSSTEQVYRLVEGEYNTILE